MRASMMMVTTVLAAGCAHQQVRQADEVTVLPPPPVAPRQLEVATAPSAPAAPTEDAAALAAALQATKVFFAFDRSVLEPEGEAALQRAAKVLRAHPTLHVQVSGNCDERGTEEYHLALGQRRAEVARAYLVALGVSPGQLDTISFGQEQPVDPRHTPEAWAQNRRDELKLLSN
jgi:peptidoglycan-associated lipoprotein